MRPYEIDPEFDQPLPEFLLGAVIWLAFFVALYLALSWAARHRAVVVDPDDLDEGLIQEAYDESFWMIASEPENRPRFDEVTEWPGDDT